MVELVQFAFQLLLYYWIPGALVTAALLRGVKLSFFDKAAIALMLGIIVNPSLAVVEYVFFGIKFSGALVMANALLMAIAGLIALYFQGHLNSLLNLPDLPSFQGSWKENKPLIAKALLLAIILVAFWVRLSPAWATNFFEFDPIFYDHVTEVLVKNGELPLTSQEVYYPLFKNFRTYPLVNYLAGGWYLQYQQLVGGGFDKDNLVLVQQIYPPLVAALMCFIAFLLVREEYDEFIGVIAAGIFAFTPHLIVKFGAGVSELQPFGFFTAMLLFAAYALALKRHSLRLGVLASGVAFAAVLSSAQAIWPLLIIALFLFLHSVIAFWRNELEHKTIIINALTVLGGVAGYFVLNRFLNAPFVLNAQLILLVGSIVPAILFILPQLVGEKKHLQKDDKKKAIAGFFTLVVIAAIIVPGITGSVVNYLNATAGFARQISALAVTIAEENATTPNLYFPSFAYLNPDLLLPLLTFVIIAASLYNLYKHGHHNIVAVLAAVSVALVVFNGVFDQALLFLTKTFFSQLVYASQFIAQSDVFVYLLLTMLALVVERIYVTQQKLSYLPILLALIIIPVSFIGLNKLKFLLHLALALALAFPVILGMLLELAKALSEKLAKEEEKQFAVKASLALLFFIGLGVVFGQATTVDDAMYQLRVSRIPPDWIATYNWMRATPTMSDDACLRTYGFKCRVLSWWDYGHWTTFFGEKYSVLDPGNEHPEFNHETARTFVHENATNIYYSMSAHQATHVLVDSDLIAKWGALVFLSGTCDNSRTPICPAKPDVNWTTNDGRAAYDTTHFYEQLQATGNCPQSVSPVPMPAIQSSLTGAIYCFAQDEYFLLANDGLDKNYSRKFKLAGRDSFANLTANYSYLFATGQNQFINVNPGLAYAGLNNTYFHSLYAKLFFFDKAPGFKLAYRSPNGQVKVFEFDPKYYAK